MSWFFKHTFSTGIRCMTCARAKVLLILVAFSVVCETCFSLSFETNKSFFIATKTISLFMQIFFTQSRKTTPNFHSVFYIFLVSIKYGICLKYCGNFFLCDTRNARLHSHGMQ